MLLSTTIRNPRPIHPLTVPSIAQVFLTSSTSRTDEIVIFDQVKLLGSSATRKSALTATLDLHHLLK